VKRPRRRDSRARHPEARAIVEAATRKDDEEARLAAAWGRLTPAQRKHMAELGARVDLALAKNGTAYQEVSDWNHYAAQYGITGRRP